ncbi:MAG: hypothetical protein LBQ88_10175, partial [Treponema sp.]|nr:hypothetical protein [Treponema sp.]
KILEKNYKEQVGEVKVQRLDGKPTRCYIGLRLRSMDEVASLNETKADKNAEDIFNSNVQTQTEPPEEENPFD